MTEHHYRLDLTWHGNRGPGTSGYRDYGREVTVRADGKPSIEGSADVPFRGEASRWNPEELLLAALAQCHLLSYLHFAVLNDIIVTEYADMPVGTMDQTGIGGHFTSVTLRPRVTVAPGTDLDLANRIHADASSACFIAASVNFEVRHEPEACWG